MHNEEGNEKEISNGREAKEAKSHVEIMKKHVHSHMREEAKKVEAQFLNEIQRKKHKDGGTFSIPCKLNSFNVFNGLCDLDASIYMISFYVCEKIGLLKEYLKPTTISKMVDHTIIQPLRIIENLLLEVDMFEFYLDFFVV